MEAGWSMWLQKLWGAFDSSCCVSEVYKLTSCHGRPPAGSAGELLGGNPHPVCLTSRANVSRAMPRAGEGGVKLVDSSCQPTRSWLIKLVWVETSGFCWGWGRKGALLSNVYTCPSSSSFMETCRWKHTYFIVSQQTSKKKKAFFFPFFIFQEAMCYPFCSG